MLASEPTSAPRAPRSFNIRSTMTLFAFAFAFRWWGARNDNVDAVRILVFGTRIPGWSKCCASLENCIFHGHGNAWPFKCTTPFMLSERRSWLVWKHNEFNFTLWFRIRHPGKYVDMFRRTFSIILGSNEFFQFGAGELLFLFNQKRIQKFQRKRLTAGFPKKTFASGIPAKALNGM